MSMHDFRWETLMFKPAVLKLFHAMEALAELATCQGAFSQIYRPLFGLSVGIWICFRI